jgi:hypothetical protein
MAAVTVLKKQYKTGHGNALVYYGTGASNTDATLTTDAVAEHSYRVSYASATYSGAATQAGVTFGIDSGLGSGYDATVTTGSANVRYSAYTPSGNVILGVGDAFTVTALAGGAVTAAIVVVLEPI